MKRRRGLIGLLVANAVSLTGTQLSMIALPWFVLVTTNSPTKTGLVAAFEIAPLVIVKALAGPIVDRLGARRVSVTTDAASAVVVAAVPALHALGLLSFWLLLGLVAVAGALRGPGDNAKQTLIPDVVDESGAPTERVTGLVGTMHRLSMTLGPASAGALIAFFGPLNALLVDAASFAVAAVIIVVTAPRRHHAHDESEGHYVDRMRVGLRFLWKDRLLRSLALMIAVTNLLDIGLTAVILPVWARETGHGVAAIGAVSTAMGATAVLGSILATAIGHRMPRRLTFLVGFLIGGAPHFVVLAFDLPLWVVIATYAAGGIGSGFLNPIISAIMIERIPRPMLGRVSSLVGSMAWGGMPFGGPSAGVLITVVGLAPAALAFGAAYFVATLLPGLRPEWRGMDHGRTRIPKQRTEPAEVGVPS